LREAADVRTAVEAGADAIGLVFYPASPRHISADAAAELIAGLPPYVAAVGLLVNPTPQEAEAIVRRVPLSLLQFHGDESIAQCREIAEAANLPFVKAIRIGADIGAADLLEYERNYRAASKLFAGLLLDAFVDGYGGGGKVFDWSLIPKELAHRVVLSGGLNAQNVIEAIHRVRPYAVDVSSGVESAKGVKDSARIRQFIETVRKAETLQSD
jgi:phosphoribosylanthranilate isomerase